VVVGIFTFSSLYAAALSIVGVACIVRPTNAILWIFPFASILYRMSTNLQRSMLLLLTTGIMYYSLGFGIIGK
jgi:hypothetical protein